MAEMLTVGKIYELLDGFAPFSKQEEWDNSGLLVGSLDREVKRIMLCLDITVDCAKEAVENDADLVISHHPVIFHPLKSLEPDNPAVILARNGVSAICAHTSVDFSPEGLNAYLARLVFGKESEGVIEDETGLGAIVTLDSELEPCALAKKVKDALGCKTVRFTPGNKAVKRVGIITGSGGSYLPLARDKKCDALVTGDVRHDVFVDAGNLGFCVIDAGHFYTENIFCSLLKEKLKGIGAEVFAAKASRDNTKTI